jgi:hypothetical protein
VRTVELELEIPADAAGHGELVVSSGQLGGDVFDCLWDPDSCAGGPAESFDELLEQIGSGHRADELTVALHLYDRFSEGDGENGGSGEPAASATVRLDEVVTGEARFEVFVADTGGCPVMPELPFVDVSPESVHARSIGCAAALGVTVGVSDAPPLFAPARPVRRDQAATFVARVLRLAPTELPAPAATSFTDIAGNVHADAIAQLTAAGIVQGRTPTTFDPAATVTRAQVATMLVKALRWSTGEPFEPTGGPYFPDVSGVHASNIDVGFEIGLLGGRSDGTFRPAATTRRDQMASLLMHFRGLVTAG